MSMTVIVSFPVKLSFDIGHESLRQGLNGWVRKKLSYVHRRLEFVCVEKELDYVHMEIRIGV
jgi:hypothetical protein